MSFNIVQDAKTFFNHEVVNKASQMLGESEAGILKAIETSVPAVFMSLEDKISSEQGSVQIAKAIQNNLNSFPDSPMAMMEKHIVDSLGKDSGVVNSLLGDKSNLISDAVSKYSGIKASSVNSLLTLVVPVVLGLLKKHTSSAGISAQSISAILTNQKDHIMNSLPHNLNIEGLISLPGMAGGTTTGGALPTTQGVKSKPAGWIIPVIIIALILLGIWYFMKGKSGTDNSVPQADTTSVAITYALLT